MSPSIGFAIVGSGHVSRYHHTAIKALAYRGARLVAVATRDPANATDIQDRYQVPALGFADICRHPGVAVVAVCTPSGDHAAKTIAAARAGKHVIVEKPMAVTTADAEQMISECATHQRLLAVAFQRRTQPLFKQLKRLVDEGALGTPLMASLVLPYQRNRAYFEAAPWRGTWGQDGGGVLMNQGIHLIDLLVWLWGNPVTVEALTARRLHQIETEDTAAVLLGFANGALATITATTAVSPGFSHRLELFGTQGGVRIEGDAVVDCRLAEGDGLAAMAGAEDADTAWSEGGKAAGHIALYTNFIDALERGVPLVCDGRQGQRSLSLIEQIYSVAEPKTLASPPPA